MVAREDDEVLEFDYVVVGAGPSAVGLLVSLMEQEVAGGNPVTIAVIERGPFQMMDDPKTRSPKRWFEAAHNSSSVVLQHAQTPEGRRVDLPTGQGLGGTSNINACLCVAPPILDFDSWPDLWGQRIMASVLHIQEMLTRNGCLLDGKTAMSDDRNRIKQSVSKWYEKFTSDCVPCLTKFNTKSRQVERVNYYQGLLEQLLAERNRQEGGSRKDHYNNLRWFCGVQAQRILLDERKSRAVGVEIEVPSPSATVPQHRELKARLDVILCAGALESPALLLASGIGRADDLAGGEIPPVCPTNAGVGRKLRDHILLPRVVWMSPSTRSINGIHHVTAFECPASQSGNKNTCYQHKYLLLKSTTVPEIALHFFSRIIQQYGVLWAQHTGMGGFLVIGLVGCMQAVLHFLVMYTPLYYILQLFLTTMNLCLVNPTSTGQVSLIKKPTSSASICRRSDFELFVDLPYITDGQDAEALRDGWTIACDDNVWREWFDRPSPLELFPGVLGRILYHLKNYLWGRYVKESEPHLDTEKQQSWFRAFARDTCLPFYHWCGTCSMATATSKKENDSVVDSSLRVRGLQSLRVCDASVFPDNISVPPALTCCALGHVFGSLLLEERSKKGSERKISS